MIGQVFSPCSLENLWPLLEDGVVVMAGGTDLLVRLRARHFQELQGRDGGDPLVRANDRPLLQAKAAFPPGDAPRANAKASAPVPAGCRPRCGDAPSAGTKSFFPPRVALLERIPELRAVTRQGDLLRLGATATHAELLEHAEAPARLPLLAAALAEIGSPPIRTMGTLGGNLATASPAGDTLPALLALDARVELASRQGIRHMPLAEFLVGPGQTALAPGEIVAAVLIAPLGQGFISHFEKVGRRKALAIAVASLAAAVRLAPDGTVAEARLAVGSLAPTAKRCPLAEKALTGHRLDRESLTRAANALRDEIAPLTDLRASADYRKAVGGNLLLRLMGKG